MKLQKYDFKLHVISPVNIGCDEVYEPSSFIIDEKNKKLIEFDKFEFYRSLSGEDKKRFNSIISKSDISSLIDLIKFISSKKVTGKEVEICSSVIERYTRILNLKPNEIKQEKFGNFQIIKSASNPYNNKPYIPGSSLKGSLRTGYLNELAKAKYNEIRYERNAQEVEKKLLGYKNPQDDRFKAIKISDFLPCNNVKTKIICAINKKKNKNEAGRGIPIIIETISEESEFIGSISVLENANIETTRFLKSNHAFYEKILKEETELLAKMGVSTNIYQAINKLFNAKLNNTAFCIRIGRHCGAEAITIEGIRKIKGSKKQDRSLSSPTTIWLASQEHKPIDNSYLIPFGWCVLEML